MAYTVKFFTAISFVTYFWYSHNFNAVPHGNNTVYEEMFESKVQKFVLLNV
jgi:hypothetical protein